MIHKRLVEFRLDFLALIRIDQILTSPSLVDIPPVFVFVQSSVSLGPTAIPYVECSAKGFFFIV